MLLKIKTFFPGWLLVYLRKLRSIIYRQVDAVGPCVRQKKYFGLSLFYNRGNGLVNRTRIGNPDRVYERELCQAIMVELKKGGSDSGLFVDIGANIGLISVYLIAHLKSLKIVAFEPGISQLSLFRVTVMANQLEKRISLLPYALDNENSNKIFFVHDDINNSGDGFVDTGRGGMTNSVIVPTIKLDSWWSDAGKPVINVIKIDTEGAELRALQGGEDMIQKVKPIIFLEISIENLQKYPYGHRDVFVWLANHGYILRTLSGVEVLDLDQLDKIVQTEDTFVGYPKK